MSDSSYELSAAAWGVLDHPIFGGEVFGSRFQMLKAVRDGDCKTEPLDARSEWVQYILDRIDQRIENIKETKNSGLEGRCQWYLVKELERLRGELETLLDHDSARESANKNEEVDM